MMVSSESAESPDDGTDDTGDNSVGVSSKYNERKSGRKVVGLSSSMVFLLKQ